jgi:hypothetical protein
MFRPLFQGIHIIGKLAANGQIPIYNTFFMVIIKGVIGIDH